MVTTYWILRRVLREVFRCGIAVRRTMTRRMAVVVGVVALRGLAPGQGSRGKGLVGAAVGQVAMLVAVLAAGAARSHGVVAGAGPKPGRVGQAADRPVQGRPQPPCTGRSSRQSVPGPRPASAFRPLPGPLSSCLGHFPRPANSRKIFLCTPLSIQYWIRGPENLWKKLPAGSRVGSSQPCHLTLKNFLPPISSCPKTSSRMNSSGAPQGPPESFCDKKAVWG